MRRWSNGNCNADDKVFGTQQEAGELLISDARLALLPVRSLTGTYRWVTCPHLIERYRRDMKRAGIDTVCDVPEVEPGSALADGEQRLFSKKESSPPVNHGRT